VHEGPDPDKSLVLPVPAPPDRPPTVSVGARASDASKVAVRDEGPRREGYVMPSTTSANTSATVPTKSTDEVTIGTPHVSGSTPRRDAAIDA
jgi:hypothetical protein